MVLVETKHQRNLVVCETRAILEHIEETETAVADPAPDAKKLSA